jgi:heat shock protein HtpX
LVYHFRGLAAEAWGTGRSSRNAPSFLGDCIALDWVPAGGPEGPRFQSCGDTLVIEIHLPADRPGTALRCRIRAQACDLSQLQRSLNRTLNHRRAGRVIAGMILLLALCGWIIGGDEGVRWALAGGTPPAEDPPISPEAMRQRFGAQLLRPAEVPILFCILMDLCRRAHLPRLPDLYCLPAQRSMNAYALGGPRASAITLTEGLLRGMTPAELAGILAHEVAHIRNNDAWAMSFATALHRAIALASLAALAALRANGFANLAGAPLALLISGAPAIGQLLWLALSRIRELDADATALDLIDDPLAFVAALQKLERHHTGAPVMAVAPRADDLVQFLSSHPATGERVGTLLRLA